MKIAIVIPWFGRDLKGGAEQQAWQIATRLAARGHEIEVLTTCCRSHQDDWESNHLRAGLEQQPEGFSIRRFAVVARDRAAFDQVCSGLMNLSGAELTPGVSPVSGEASAVFVNELIKSPELLGYLEANEQTFDWFLFLPYLYGLVLHGVLSVADRALLQPCLHDESYAYLPEVADAFHLASKLLFNSEGEMELALRLFGPGIWNKSTVVGEGVEDSDALVTNGQLRSNAANIGGPYVLCLGRKEEGKNTPMLLRAFRRFRAVRPNSDMQLVLAGHGDAKLSADDKQVHDLGVVSDADRDSLLNGCIALFQPSEKESFSRVMMEAWLRGKPVAAHSSCLATAVAVNRARGGWVAGGEAEWAALFAEVARTHPRQLAGLGERGRSYARVMAEWEKVIDRYEEVLAPEIAKASPIALEGNGPGGIHQFLPNLSYGDAISNYAIWIRDQIRQLGLPSEIYVRYIDPRVEHECRVFSPEALVASDAAIYHHSVGSEITPHVANFPKQKCLIYHNITPAEFFEPFWPEYAPTLRRGRDDLRLLAPQFPLSFGVSQYNADELREHGFRNPGICPIGVDPTKWNFPADPAMMARLQDGRTNILFVGRIAPNKKQEDLVTAFYEYLSFDPTARLIIVGKAEENDRYAAHLLNVIRDLGVEDSVYMPGSITDAELAACYRNADLFWSMSEHEGFCVPLIEAMWFDVPILAFRSSAIPETLGPAGLLFTDKNQLVELAALAHILIQDVELRDRMLRAQRQQRRAFLPREIAPQITDLARKLLPADTAFQEK
ncbi:MAG: glycosyltransferase family 4 protein [Chthoniobacterales bacterium]